MSGWSDKYCRKGLRIDGNNFKNHPSIYCIFKEVNEDVENFKFGYKLYTKNFIIHCPTFTDLTLPIGYNTAYRFKFLYLLSLARKFLLNNGLIDVEAMRKLIFWITLIILIYACAEIFSYGGLFILKKYHQLDYAPIGDVISNKHRTILTTLLEGKTHYLVFSSTLGWTIKENGTSELYQVNCSGIRSNKDYELNPPINVFRIGTFGDSFTHCDDVPNNATWQTILETLNPKLEVMNFGVPGYGLDQAYLRYLEKGLKYDPHLVLIGFVPKDVFRHVNVFRPFYFSGTGLPLTKPRFRIENEALSLISNPMQKLDDYNKLLLAPKEILPQIGLNDFYYSKRYRASSLDFSPTFRFLKLTSNNIITSRSRESIIVAENINESSEAFLVTKKIFDEFTNSIIKNNSVPLIAIFPDEDDVIRYRNHGTKSYFPFISYFDFKAYQYIDLMDVFEKTGKGYEIKKLFVNGHYSPLTNEFVARYIQSYLLDNGFVHVYHRWGREKVAPK